jgi:spore coat polysaccharide biosynthesis predicted glycosyltransferase SpsG
VSDSGHGGGGGHLRRAKALANFSRGRGDTGTYSSELNQAKSVGHLASTTDCCGRAPAKAKLAEYRAQ